MPLVWVIMLGFLVLGDVPNRWTLAGAAIMVMSGLHILHGVRGREDPTFVLTLPDSGPRIARAFAATAATTMTGSAPGFSGLVESQDMDAAVGEAFRWARPDGIVLLSPAAPSFGRFRDYRDRGDQFANAMRALT